ncbi:MAG: NAD(P)/FAD-dependent oxidoreductase [Planctomycetes bacterium]|nr:NAD(P)/FAD-dependent oxidoreductase [Planctomycetota bacterium]
MKPASKSIIAIVGAGPAGLSAAIHAAQSRHVQVFVLEANPMAGRKLLITGGGRCNLTHDLDPRAFQKSFCEGGRFLSYALHEYPVDHVVTFFKECGLAMRTEPNGCVFPVTDRASDVRDLLVKEAVTLGVQFKYGQSVTAIHKKGEQFLIRTAQETLVADRVILATGGQSYPQTGSTGDGYRFARGLGHTVVTPRPSLVPMVLNQSWPQEVAGTSLEHVTLTAMRDGKSVSASGKLVFTQNGVGGFAAQDMSRFLTDDLPNPGHPIPVFLDCLAQVSISQLDVQIRDLCQAQPKKAVHKLVSTLIPKRLAKAVLGFCECPDTLLACQLSKPKRLALAQTIKGIKLTVIGTRSIEEATVTRGGIDTGQISPKTMGSTLCPGLYFAGEMINVDGPCGGYHLQMCWSTGAAAGHASAPGESNS